jgi:regulator of cell morphogenesis and NO signaling
MLPHALAATVAAPARDGAPRPEETTAAPAPPPARDRLPGAALVAQIVGRHHAYERRALPYIVAMLAKVAGCHRHRNAKLGVLCDTGQELADTLEAHLDDEERELFPALLAGATGPDAVRGGLDRMTRHHRALSVLLARVRWLADDFAVPPWGGHAYQVLMEELGALEEDVLEHMHLERSTLDPHPA